MLLATRCPHCHTVFRVVADQLKLRGGLVRCGHCKEIFDAHAHLCDSPDTVDAATATQTAAPVIPPSPSDAPSREASPPDAQDATTIPPEPAAAVAETADAVTATPAPQAPESDAVPAQALLRHADDSDASLSTPADPATRPPRPRRPRTGLWRAIAGVLLVAALAQVAWLQRDSLVNRWGVLYAPLSRLCQWAGCTIAPPRQIDALAIESSNLSRDPGASGDASAGGQVLTLTVFLRNNAATPVAFPALELTLSDEQSRPVVRRVFRAAEYAAPGDLARGLTPRAERVIRLRLMSTVAVAANYRVAALYP